MKLMSVLVAVLFLVGGACAAQCSVFKASDFGAVGDGIADDTAAIQKAIDAASESGGVVELGKGKFRITGSLKIESSSVVMNGLGRQITTIWADGKDFHAVMVGRDDKEVQHVALSSFSVDRPEQADSGIVNVYIVRSRYSSIENMSMGNGGDGIFVGSVTSPDICGCISINKMWIGGCRRDLVVACAADVIVSQMYAGFTEVGVYLTHCANNVRIIDSVFLTSRPTQGKHGLVSDAGFMQEVKSCVFEETSEEVILVKNVPRFYFHDNWLNANPDYAMIRMESVTQFSIRNTRYGGSGTRCVELEKCSRGDVTGCSMESSRGIACNIIHCGDIEIADNQMGGNEECGIKLSGGAHSIRISGNHISGGECAIHLTDTAGDKFIIRENFMTKGRKGTILDESKAKTKVIGDNIEE